MNKGKYTVHRVILFNGRFPARSSGIFHQNVIITLVLVGIALSPHKHKTLRINSSQIRKGRILHKRLTCTPERSRAFTSVNPRLKALLCFDRIHRYMDSKAKDIVGRAAYPFYHPTDVFHIQKLHSKRELSLII